MTECHICGSAVFADQRFCETCGAQIGSPSPTKVEPISPLKVPYIPEPDANIGKVIANRFELTNTAGHRYYTAVDRRNTERLTIRLFSYDSFGPRDDVIDRLERQYLRNRKVDHPMVARAGEVLVESDCAAVTLKCLGQSLQYYLHPPRRNRVEVETFEQSQRQISRLLLKDILVQIFDVVSAMHDANLVNGYLTHQHILVDDYSDLSSPRIKLVPFGTKRDPGVDHPDRFHYDDETLTPAADIYYLGRLIKFYFAPLIEPLKEKVSSTLHQACLESRTNRIQTLGELRNGLAPIFETEWSDEQITGDKFWVCR